VWCDSAYQGRARRVARLRLCIDIVKNPSRHQFIAVYPRWIIERSFAWLSAHRRLGQRDLEHTIEAAETWIKVAAIATMLDRLAPKPATPQARSQQRR
jgi:transposase